MKHRNDTAQTHSFITVYNSMGFKYPPRKENAQPAVDSSPKQGLSGPDPFGWSKAACESDGWWARPPVAICCLMRFWPASLWQ